MHESSGYPSSNTKLSKEALSKLIELPKPHGNSLTVTWFQENVWKDTVSYDIPSEAVICGMQANIFKIVLKNDTGPYYNVFFYFAKL